MQLLTSVKIAILAVMTANGTLGFRANVSDSHLAFVPSDSPSEKSLPRLFDGLSNAEVAQFITGGAVRQFKAGEVLIHAGHPGTHLFLIKEGAADYYRLTPEGRQILVTQLVPGDYFGLVTMLSKPVGYMGTAEATRETEVYIWEHTWVRQFAAKHPLVMENAFRIALRYVEVYADRHLALVSGNVEDRLRKAIAHLEIQGGHHHAGGLEIDITNERLASLADVGYFTTSRLLNKWKRMGAIEKHRGKIVVLSPEKLLGGEPVKTTTSKDVAA